METTIIIKMNAPLISIRLPQQFLLDSGKIQIDYFSVHDSHVLSFVAHL